MSDSIKDKLSENAYHMKETSSKRISSIKKILQEATAQTVAELKIGGSELGETAKDTLKSASEEWQKIRNQENPVRQAVTHLHPGETISSLLDSVKNQPVSEQVKDKLAKLDSDLAARYGNRYEALSQKRRQIVDWYSKTLADSEIDDATWIDGHQAQAHERASSAGTSVARKEKQIQEYFKAAFRNATKR